MKDTKGKVSSWYNDRRCFHTNKLTNLNVHLIMDKVWKDTYKSGNNGFFREEGTRMGRRVLTIYLHSTCYNIHVLLLYF